MQATKNKLSQLQTIITKMPVDVCAVTVLPEFGVHWKEVSRALRNARLPITSGSIAQVLCRHAARAMPDELDDVLGRLRLQLVATQARTWHVLRLQEPITDEPVSELVRTLPYRVLKALRNGRHRGRPEVHSITLNDLIYLSIQFVSDIKNSSILYIATPPGEPIALVSSVGSGKLLKPCVEGLGYAKYTNADLHGKDIPSLLRLSNPYSDGQADHLTNLPPYEPTPTILPNGIDYTNKTYDEKYVENVLGPNPPILTDLDIKSVKSFFNREQLNKTISLSVSLKSEDVAKTLKTWVVKGALAPTSDFFQIFQNIKTNKIDYVGDDSD